MGKCRACTASFQPNRDIAKFSCGWSCHMILEPWMLEAACDSCINCFLSPWFYGKKEKEYQENWERDNPFLMALRDDAEAYSYKLEKEYNLSSECYGHLYEGKEWNKYEAHSNFIDEHLCPPFFKDEELKLDSVYFEEWLKLMRDKTEKRILTGKPVKRCVDCHAWASVERDGLWLCRRHFKQRARGPSDEQIVASQAYDTLMDNENVRVVIKRIVKTVTKVVPKREDRKTLKLARAIKENEKLIALALCEEFGFMDGIKQKANALTRESVR